MTPTLPRSGPCGPHTLLAAAFAVSVGVHAIAAWTLTLTQRHPSARSERPSHDRVISLHLDVAAPTPPPPAPATAAPTPAPPPKPTRRKAATKVVRAPAPGRPAVPKPSPTPATDTAGAPHAPPAPAHQAPRPTPAIAAVTAPPAAAPTVAAAAAAQDQQRYLHALMAAIEASKRYPAAAQRRRITGTVEVSFVLLGSGEVRELQFSGGHPLLRTAAARAMQRAQPFPSPPAGLDCPRRLRFSMVFRQR